MKIICPFVIVTATIMFACSADQKRDVQKEIESVPEVQWIIPDTSELTGSTDGKLIKYGRSLIVNTAYYLGPKGIIAHKSNGLNCQNCHLAAGTKKFGSNFALVASNYPRFKERSGKIESLVRKVNDCFERSLNGQGLDSSSYEMRAFVAYLKWIGKNVPKGVKPAGSGIEELALLSRASDTTTGKAIFAAKCQSCHGKSGEGVMGANQVTYTYPPLWGDHSYNTGASIYRISKLAGYVKNNMPFGSDYSTTQLTDAEAWDVAAFVNSKYHPKKDVGGDYPQLASKPYDYPFGPYADSLFTADQRKYGPYDPIVKYYKSLKKQ